MDPANLRIEPLTDAWRAAAEAAWTAAWGEPRVVSRGRIHDLRTLEAFVALEDGPPPRLLGIFSLAPDAAGDLEVVSIEALEPRRGVGAALLDVARQRAIELGARRVWLITTNDNTSAQAFYTAAGWRLVTVHFDAVTEARALKPAIPELGEDGTPIRDELEFEWRPGAPGGPA